MQKPGKHDKLSEAVPPDTAFQYASAVKLMLQNLAIMQQILCNARGIALMTIQRARMTRDSEREKTAETMLQNITHGEKLLVRAEELAIATTTGELNEDEALSQLRQIHHEVKNTASIFHAFRQKDVQRRAL